MPQVVVGAALSTGLGYAFGTVTAATLASTFAQNLILGAISYALQDKPKMAEQGLNIGNVREPVSPRKVIYGETRVGGTYLFVDTSEVVWAILATNPSQLPTDHPSYDDGGEGGAADFNVTDDPITYSSGITINADTYYLATDADGNQCYTGNTTKTYGRIGYLRTKRHNEFFQFVTAVAGHEVEEISDIYFEDEHIATFNQTNNVAETLETGVTRFNSDSGRQKPLFEYREGTSTQTAFRSMLDNIPFDHTTYKTTGVVYGGATSAGWTQNNAWADCGRNLKYVDGGTQPKDFTDYESVGQAWSADHQCKDTAIVYGRLAYNPNVYINGLPKVTYRVKGKKLYDPRTSSTAYGNNAALCILDYLMDNKYGLGVSTSEINMQSFEDAADVCDEDVTLAEGGTEKRYTINGMIDTSLTPRDVLENMLTACAGKLIYVNGQFTLLAAEYRTPSASITEDDIISSISVATKNSNRSNYNGVKGQFRDPNSEPPFIATEYPVVTSSAFETIDGKQSYTNLDLPFTTSSPTAQRLAKLLLNRSRQEVTISFKAKLSAINITAGDTISVTNNRLSFSNKTFEVTSSELGFDGTSMYVAITAVEVSSATFDWNAEESAIINNTWTEYRQFEVPAPTDLDVTTNVVVQTDGTAVGGFTITWNASLSENVTAYEVQWKVSTDTDYQSTVTGETSLIGNGTFITGATYNVRVRSLTRNGGFSDWVSTTADIPDDAIAPSAPSGLTATGGQGFITLDWTGNTEADLAGYEVYENSSNDSGTATQIAKVTADQFTRGGLNDSVTRYYWVKAYDFSGNASAFSSVASASTNAAVAAGEDGQDAAGLYKYDISGTTSGLSNSTLNSYFSTASSGKTKVAGDTLIVQKTDGSEATAYIYNGSLWVEQTGGYFSGDVLIDGTLTVNAIKSGVKTLVDGSFGMGYSTTWQGVDIQVYGESTVNGQLGLGGINTATSGSEAHGLGALAASPDSFAIASWNAPSAGGQTKFYCFGAGVGAGLQAGQESYATNINTTKGICGTNDYGVSGEYKAYGDSLAKSLGILGYYTAAGIFRWRNPSTGADLKTVDLCNATYAIEAVGGSTGTFTAAHDGLLLKTEAQPEIGDILVDNGVYYNRDITETICTNSVSTSANQKGVIGVFAQYAGVDHIPYAISVMVDDESRADPDIENQELPKVRAVDPQFTDIDDYNFLVMNAIGEGMINVCGENGDIAVGDLIVTSNTAGKGMKQDDDIVRSYTVAKAREAVTFASAGEVHQIACIYLCG
jgi:hypothetical protein